MTLEIWFVAALLLTLNLAAFLAQGLDKQLARRGARRISQTRLALMGLPLAAAGMWLGMRVFQHKTNKPSFLALAAAVTAGNFALVWALYECWSRNWLEFRA